MSALYSRLLQLFRERHPSGTVVTELVRTEAGLYVTRAEVRIDRQWILGSGLAVHADLERAEERAIERALAVAGFSAEPDMVVVVPSVSTPVPPSNGAPYQAVPLAPPPLLPYEEPVASGNGNGHHYAPGEHDLAPAADLSDMLAQTDVQMKRIGWQAKEGRDYLQRTFGKNTRSQLDAAELQEFLGFLKAQPNLLARRPPNQAPF